MSASDADLKQILLDEDPVLAWYDLYPEHELDLPPERAKAKVTPDDMMALDLPYAASKAKRLNTAP